MIHSYGTVCIISKFIWMEKYGIERVKSLFWLINRTKVNTQGNIRSRNIFSHYSSEKETCHVILNFVCYLCKFSSLVKALDFSFCSEWDMKLVNVKSVEG